MAAKRKGKSTEDEGRHYGKTAREWKDWGQTSGKDMGEAGKCCVEQFGNDMQHGRHWRESRSGMWIYSLGIAGPLIGSVIGMFFLVVGVVFLNLINLILWSPFISAVAGFLWANISIFFVLMLFMGYGKYLSRMHPLAAWIFPPIAACVGIVIFLWIGAFILGLLNTHINSAFIADIALYINQNLFGIFFVLLVFFYIFAIAESFVFGSFIRMRRW